MAGSFEIKKKISETKYKKHIAIFEEKKENAKESLGNLGRKELQIIESFKVFINIFEKIKNKPNYTNYSENRYTIGNENNLLRIKSTSAMAGLLLDSLEGVDGLDVAARIGAVGATTSELVIISNRRVWWCPFGRLVFDIIGDSLSKKINVTQIQREQSIKKIEEVSFLFKEIEKYAMKFNNCLNKIDSLYMTHLNSLISIVETNNKIDWFLFTVEEKNLTKNLILLLSFINKIVKTNLLLSSDDALDVNKEGLQKTMLEIEQFINKNEIILTKNQLKLNGMSIDKKIKKPQKIDKVEKIVPVNNHMIFLEKQQQQYLMKFEIRKQRVQEIMGNLGEKELLIMETFKIFTELFDKIENKPQFIMNPINNYNIINENNLELLKLTSVMAGLLLKNNGFRVEVGSKIGLVASGASKIAAIGGTLDRLGTEILAVNTRDWDGFFWFEKLLSNILGDSISKKNDITEIQIEELKNNIDTICSLFGDIEEYAIKFNNRLDKIDNIYMAHLTSLISIIQTDKKIDWNLFTEKEKLLTKSTTLIVDLLSVAVKTKLFSTSNGKIDINQERIDREILKIESFINNL